MPRFVADLGNTRLKWARVGPGGLIPAVHSMDVEALETWPAAPDYDDGEATRWAISTVNPPAAERLSKLLEAKQNTTILWFRSAADVPLRTELEHPAATGADRALAVLAAAHLMPPGRPGLVISCGTAITVESVAADGTWLGGAIAPGLTASAQALNRRTAQLPLIVPSEAPAPLGRATDAALAAGLFWGTIGAIREIAVRQAAGLNAPPWIVWTGGDAPLLAPALTDAMPSGLWKGPPRIVPDLVLLGLVRAAFAVEPT